MLFCTSLIALVGAADQPQSSPRKLQIVNTKVCVTSQVYWEVQEGYVCPLQALREDESKRCA